MEEHGRRQNWENWKNWKKFWKKVPEEAARRMEELEKQLSRLGIECVIKGRGLAAGVVASERALEVRRPVIRTSTVYRYGIR